LCTAIRTSGRSSNYLNHTYTAHDIFTGRTDFLNDARGQRTGFKTRNAEFDLGYTHWVGDALELRSEIRFDHAFDAEAYDNPTDYSGGWQEEPADACRGHDFPLLGTSEDAPRPIVAGFKLLLRFPVRAARDGKGTSESLFGNSSAGKAVLSNGQPIEVPPA